MMGNTCNLTTKDNKCRIICWKYEDKRCCYFCVENNICEKPCEWIRRIIKKNKKG